MSKQTVQSALARAFTNFNMITGSVTAIRWSSVADKPITVRSFTLKTSPGAEIPHYTMADAVGIDKPLGSASDQLYADLMILSTFLKDTEGVTVETIGGGSEVNGETGEVTGKTITRIIFTEPYPVFMLQRIDTGNSGRTVFKLIAFEPQPVAVPEVTGAETEEIPGGTDDPIPGGEHKAPPLAGKK